MIELIAVILLSVLAVVMAVVGVGSLTDKIEDRLNLDRYMPKIGNYLEKINKNPLVKIIAGAALTYLAYRGAKEALKTLRGKYIQIKDEGPISALLNGYSSGNRYGPDMPPAEKLLQGVYNRVCGAQNSEKYDQLVREAMNVFNISSSDVLENFVDETPSGESMVKAAAGGKIKTYIKKSANIPKMTADRFHEMLEGYYLRKGVSQEDAHKEAEIQSQVYLAKMAYFQSIGEEQNMPKGIYRGLQEEMKSQLGKQDPVLAAEIKDEIRKRLMKQALEVYGIEFTPSPAKNPYIVSS